MVKMRKIGTSMGIIIPASICRRMDIHVNDSLRIDDDSHSITLTRIEAFNPQSLEELFCDFPDNYQSEIVVDDLKGREVL